MPETLAAGNLNDAATLTRVAGTFRGRVRGRKAANAITLRP